MDYFNWIAQERALGAAALTVRAQTINRNDNGRLLWDVMFPRVDVETNELDALFGAVDFRPVADRREWNLRGRLINERVPGRESVTWTPIESYFHVDEEEVYRLLTRTGRNVEAFRDIIRTRLPQRTDALTRANYRRIEVDSISGWVLGQYTVRNPQTGVAYTTELPYIASAPERYAEATTAHSDPGVNAYRELVDWYKDAVTMTGGAQGVMLRDADIRVVEEDAPRMVIPAGNGEVASMEVTRSNVEDRIRQATGSPFRFYQNELTLDIYPDGGLQTVRTKVWPAGYVAAVPTGGRVGNTNFAPVLRAVEASSMVPEAGVDVNGMTAYAESENGGRSLTLEVEVFALPMPDEQAVAVLRTKVAA